VIGAHRTYRASHLAEIGIERGRKRACWGWADGGMSRPAATPQFRQISSYPRLGRNRQREQHESTRGGWQKFDDVVDLASWDCRRRSSRGAAVVYVSRTTTSSRYRNSSWAVTRLHQWLGAWSEPTMIVRRSSRPDAPSREPAPQEQRSTINWQQAREKNAASQSREISSPSLAKNECR